MPENRCLGSQACGLRFSAEGGRERDTINPALMLKAKGQACAPCCKVDFCLFVLFRGGTNGPNEADIRSNNNVRRGAKLTYFTHLMPFQLTRENAMMWTDSLKEMSQQRPLAAIKGHIYEEC